MFRTLCLFATFALTAAAEQRPTAFQAFASVPREAAWHLAKIAACEGGPQPERWHFVVHESQAENGVRDYVVADSQIVSINGASQFAEEVRPEDVLVLNSIHVDSAYVAQLAAQYAAANEVSIASMNYELQKSPTGVPLWKAKCVSPSNRTLGWLVVDAGDGKVVAQSGFAITPMYHHTSPGEPIAGNPSPASPPASAPQSPPRAATNEPPPVGEQSPKNADASTGGFRPPSPPSPSERSTRPPTSRPREIEVRRAEIVTREPPPERRKFEIRIFRPGKKLFDFGED